MAAAENELSTTIKRIVVERLFLEVAPEKLGANESLTDAYGVDSVRLFDLIVGMEDEFGISFEDDELLLDNFDTVEAIAKRVRDKQGS